MLESIADNICCNKWGSSILACVDTIFIFALVFYASQFTFHLITIDECRTHGQAWLHTYVEKDGTLHNAGQRAKCSRPGQNLGREGSRSQVESKNTLKISSSVECTRRWSPLHSSMEPRSLTAACNKLAKKEN